jgi:energy-coupling factor transport system substrate-specific component
MEIIMKLPLRQVSNVGPKVRTSSSSVKIKDIVMIGMMGALIFILQVALRFLPNVELVSLMIILCTLTFERKALYIIYVFTAVEGLLYGFGIWWINYLYVWTVLYFVTILFRRFNSSLVWAVICGGFGFCFGALCSIPYFITGGVASGFAYWVAGIPYDVAHGIANFIIALVLYYPLRFILNKINKQTAG